MKKTCYIFCHGFGLDSSFWFFLKDYFKDEKTFYCDLGYFGEPFLPKVNSAQYDYVGIGHSLGLLKLLSLPISWKFLIGLHGFINFLGNEETLRAVRQREWASMCLQFKRSPQVTLQRFYQRAGIEFSPAWERMHLERLSDDLQKMIIPAYPMQPILFLGSQKDLIVPPELLQDNVNCCAHGHVQYIDAVQHNLGYILPDVVWEVCRMGISGWKRFKSNSILINQDNGK